MKDFFDKNKNLFLQPEKWRVSEISIPLDGDDQKAREQATTIQSRLRAGIPFEKLAQDFSASASKARGGDIGYIERGRSSATNEQIYNLQPGQITEPIRLPDGYRIYKCTEKIPTKQRTLDDTSVHQECQKRLRFQQIQQFIQAVKRDAKVEIY